ncbi:ring zinc finger protein [Anaeramoeba ignava]|uniref:Ring zinc finger protein n=1 Tax=Anaeramoeba ignava TaxID=1746090 RepID=A0A9Q0LFR1_ANAIG|nr:ring zinc finger protein [Anaeramoeba ignava]
MIQFIKITKSLKSEFPSPTQEDLDHDNICIICREEMTISNSCKLPCTHCFHRVCLRRWFKQKRKCPTCDLDLMDK